MASEAADRRPAELDYVIRGDLLRFLGDYFSDLQARVLRRAGEAVQSRPKKRWHKHPVIVATDLQAAVRSVFENAVSDFDKHLRRREVSYVQRDAS